MAMGKKRARQQDLWIATKELPRSRGHIFYEWVNKILNGAGFDEFAEENVFVSIRARRWAGRASPRACISGCC